VTRRLAVVFPGQGSQHQGMLDALPDYDAVARLLDAAEALTGLDLRVVARSGTPEQLADTRVAQPLLFLADWAWGRAVLESAVRPEAMAGHSLGELAALAVAGVFSVEAGLELVVERSRLMADCAAAAPGGMVAVLGLDAEAASQVLESVSGVWVANDNAPGQVVVSGTVEGLEAATRGLAEAGARRLVPLNVAGPFHTPLMRPAADAFARLLGETTFRDSTFPVYQNTDPTPASDAATLRTRLTSQMVSPVRWTETMRALADAGVDTLVEAGPGSVLKGLARRIDPLRGVSASESGIDPLLEEVFRS
jgi:[acyl-carrier-protein] S-malonyltransferase